MIFFNFMLYEQNLEIIENFDIYDVINYYEQKHKIPKGLLKAIMLVESDGRRFAVFGGEKSYFFKQEKDAVELVKKLESSGYTNINVGYMQINLQHHRKELPMISDFFSPFHNVNYAAKYLKLLHKRFNSWKRAVGFYHAGSKSEFYNAYMEKLSKHIDINKL